MGSKRLQKEKQSSKRKSQEIHSGTKSDENLDRIKHDMDDILDEIDGVLEENAQEFVDGYRQLSGQ